MMKIDNVIVVTLTTDNGGLLAIALTLENKHLVLNNSKQIRSNTITKNNNRRNNNSNNLTSLITSKQSSRILHSSNRNLICSNSNQPLDRLRKRGKDDTQDARRIGTTSSKALTGGRTNAGTNTAQRKTNWQVRETNTWKHNNTNRQLFEEDRWQSTTESLHVPNLR